MFVRKFVCQIALIYWAKNISVGQALCLLIQWPMFTQWDQAMFVVTAQLINVTCKDPGPIF